MKISNFGICVAVTLCAFSLSGCKEKYPAASPACVEMNETKDLVRKAELEKYCPTGGEYKPSPVVNW